MTLQFAPYIEQAAHWPASGRHILAQYDDSTIIVYQAYGPAIGLFAIEHQCLGGEFKYRRMSWIKPNFLWMMYRSGWGVKPGQEITLAFRIPRPFFESVLAQAVPSTYDPELYPDKKAWKVDVARSDVRLQWDPDHHPSGKREPRRAIQLGLRREVLRDFGQQAIIEIIDMTEFVQSQRPNVEAGDYHLLMTPRGREGRRTENFIATS